MYQQTKDVNKALLVNLEWKMLPSSNNIWVQVVSAEYLTKGKFLELRNPQRFYHMEIHFGTSLFVEKRPLKGHR